MSNQNRFLLPHAASTSGTSGNVSNSSSTNTKHDTNQQSSLSQSDQENRQLSVDTDFDSYWEEEARNPHRNRIRIGRQYQATVPPLLKPGEKDQRKLDELETLSFCPKRSARVSNAELDHYFTVAKSLNLFASLVETRSLLGRDVTIADLNHIRNKEGLSLASVIQPSRHSNVSPQSSQQAPSNLMSSSASNTATASQQSPPSSSDNNNKLSMSSTSSSPREALASQENFTYNQPLMKALSHFISLHHPCHHDSECKKLLKELPLEDDSAPVVSITAGNLRQCTSSGAKGRSRSSYKNTNSPTKADETDSGSAAKDTDQNQAASDGVPSPSYDNWTREEVELFSKAIEVCGKNFGSIKKEFLPSKSVRSIVEYYYIGSRDVSDGKRKSSQSIEANDGCTSPEKSTSNNNNNSQGGGPSSSSGGARNGPSQAGVNNLSSSSSSSNRPNNSSADSSSKNLGDSGDCIKRTSSDMMNSSKTDSLSCKQAKIEEPTNKSPAKTIDPRMSVYNFDDEFKDESPVKFDCPRPGLEVRPLKANPIMPNASLEAGEAGNSNVGSLKFFMDGQLVLKLNACQEQQEEKCHWVQSSDKVTSPNNRQKRYTKRAGDRASSDPSHNGSQSNSVVSSNHDEDSKTEDLTADEDSKESAISYTTNNTTTTPKQKSFSSSPTPKRVKTKNDSNVAQQQQQQQQQQLLLLHQMPSQPQQQQPPLQPQPQCQLPSPIDYNRLAVNNRMKERNDNLNQSSLVNQAASMPWLQANSFAMAAALLGGLPFPAAAAGLIPNQLHNTPPAPPPPVPAQQRPQPLPAIINMAPSSKPMDLSLEHNPPKPIQTKPSNRSRSRPKNS